jgi:hypothetical protein
LPGDLFVGNWLSDYNQGQEIKMTMADRKSSKTRSTLILIILASILCYCLGIGVLWVSRLPRPEQTLTPTPNLTAEAATRQAETAAAIPTATGVLFISATPTVLSPTPTWTPSQTFTPFKTWTGTPTGTATQTLPPSQTPTVTDTVQPSNTPIPATETPVPSPTS